MTQDADRERWHVVDSLFQAALERPLAEREHYLREACAGDHDLYREVESLLAHSPADEPSSAWAAAAAVHLITQPAALEPGQRVGSYEILSFVASGGMGEVYRARDTTLGRNVALKVLPEGVATDRERLARFQREAEMLAALNHPNIAAIYGVEKSGGITALVMELVDGSTLADRIAQGALSIEEALPIAKQIAEALEAAHEQHIIHRDLKPANIKVRPDATVKVLDFGLAKALDATGAVGGSSVLTSPKITTPAMTQAGVILGTASYMSPEQARGRSVDKRADIWAFGAILYEMLTGIRAFDGDDVPSTLASVLKNTVEWARLPVDTPPALRRLVMRCLKKDPKERLRDIGDASTEIADLIVSADEPLGAAPAPTQVGWRRALPWTIAAAAVATAAVLGVVVAFQLRSGEPPRVVRFTVAPPEKLNFNLVGGNIVGGTGSQAFNGGVISPDGRKLAFTTQDSTGTIQIWIRPLAAASAYPLRGTEGAVFPFWSPDSRFLGFFAAGQLKKVDVSGGSPQTLASAPGGRGGAWSRDGIILFAPNVNGVLMRVADTGGEPTPVTKLLQGEAAHRQPYFLSDGRHFLYRSFGATSRLMMGSLDSEQTVLPLAADSQAVYASGHLLFVREGTLMAQPFDAKALTLGGAAFSVAEQVASDRNNGIAAFDASENGVLTYRTGASAGNMQLTWFDRTGKILGTIDQPGAYNSVTLSPDGARVASSRIDSTGNEDIWVDEFARGTSTRLTFDPAPDYMPVWSPDGTRIVWSSARDGRANLYQKASNGTGSDEALLKSSEGKVVNDWSFDGRFLLFMRDTDLFVLPLGGCDRQMRPYVNTNVSETQGRFSPDGKFVAYTSNATGRPEIYVQTFPTAANGKWKVSQGGGTQPRWRRDGRELFYIAGDSQLMAVSASTSPSFVAGTPKALFAAPVFGAGATTVVARYDVASDGQRFLINATMADNATAPITVVLNWQEELKQRVPTR
jgi:serine/threonine protein kinase/Tol biopolymer transport system component